MIAKIFKSGNFLARSLLNESLPELGKVEFKTVRDRWKPPLTNKRSVLVAPRLAEFQRFERL